MADSILDWLDAEEGPQDIYSLLGCPRFDPDQKGLKDSISKASRELLPYQSHNNNAVAQKAMRLLTELGGAEIVVGDPEKLKEHDKQIVDLLYDDYARQHGDDVESWNRDDLKSWLANTAVVHKRAVESTLELLCPAPVEEVVEVEVIDDGEDEQAEATRRAEAKKRALAKRKKAIQKRKQAAAERKKRDAERKKKKQSDRLEDILEELGVRPQNADWRMRSTRKSRKERRSGKGRGKKGNVRGQRGRRHQKSGSMVPLIVIGGVLVVGLIALWLIFGGAKQDPAVVKVTLDPADATLTVYHVVDPDDRTQDVELGEAEGVTIDVVEDLHTVTFVGFDEANSYQVIARHPKHIEHGFGWSPKPRSTLEQELKLPPKKGGE